MEGWVPTEPTHVQSYRWFNPFSGWCSVPSKNFALNFCFFFFLFSCLGVRPFLFLLWGAWVLASSMVKIALSVLLCGKSYQVRHLPEPPFKRIFRVLWAQNRAVKAVRCTSDDSLLCSLARVTPTSHDSYSTQELHLHLLARVTPYPHYSYFTQELHLHLLARVTPYPRTHTGPGPLKRLLFWAQEA